MKEEKNILEMGLMNISDVLLNLYNETNQSKNILKDIHNTLIENFKYFTQKVNKNVSDVPKHNTKFIKSQAINSGINNTNNETFIKSFMGNFFNGLKKFFGKSNQTNNNKTPKNETYIGTQNNIIFDKKFNEKTMKQSTNFFEQLNKFLLFPNEKYEKSINFFNDFNNVLVKIRPTLFDVGAGISFITLSLLAMNFVSLLSLMKLVVLLPLLGVGFGLLIGSITKAISGVGFFKAFVVLHQLPAIFLAMGKSILFLSIGLLLFEKVGWMSLIKMASAMLFLSIVFSKYISNGKFIDFAVLISLGVSIFFLAKSLKHLENVDWTTIGKFSVFMMSLSMALNLFSMGGRGSDKNAYTMLAISISLIAIGVALRQIQTVKWSDVLMINTFILMLGYSLKLGGFSGLKISPLTIISIGLLALSLAIMQLANVDVLSVLKVIGIIGLLGFTINKLVGDGGMKMGGLSNLSGTSSFSLIKFAFGLAIMSLSLYALGEVPIEYMMKTILFVTSLGLALRAFSGRSKYGGLFGFSMGLGVMVLAILAMDEVPISAMTKTLLFIVTLGLSLRVFNGKNNSLFRFSFGLGMMVLALYAMNELPFSAIFKTIGALLGFVLVTKLLSPTSLSTLIGLSVAILAVSYSFKKVSESKIEWETLAKFGVFLVGIGAVVALMGVPVVAGLIGLGSIVMIGLMASVLLASLAIKKVSNSKIDYSNIWDFMLAVGTLSLGFALIAIPAVLGLVGAVLFIPIALSALLGAEALKLISAVEFNTQNIDNFMYGVKSLSMGFFKNAMFIGIGLIPSAMFIGIAISAYLGAVALSKISTTNVNRTKIESFNDGLSLLVKMYGKFSVIQVGKTAIKATALLPVMGVTYLSALVLGKINKLDIDKRKIGNFGESFETLITVMSDVVSKQKDKLVDIKPALTSVMEIVNVSSKLATVVQQMADMKFNEYNVVNGKLVLVKQRQLTDADFKAVGTNMGTLIEALLKPIEQLGGNSSSFTLGNKVISNPFKSNTYLKGIDVIKRMGDAYLPLANSIQKLAQAELMDTSKTSTISASMMELTFTFSTIFDELNDVKFKNANKSINEIIRYNELLSNLDIKTMDKFRTIGSDFVNKFSDEILWKKVRYNITYMRKEVEKMIKSINTLNLEKAKFFEANLRLLVDKNNAKNLAEILEVLKELVGISIEHSAKIEEAQNIQNNAVSDVSTTPQNNNEKSITPNEKVEDKSKLDMSAVTSKLDEVASLLSGVNQKLGGVIKVKNINTANSI